jgi:hypothetical protein
VLENADFFAQPGSAGALVAKRGTAHHFYIHADILGILGPDLKARIFAPT